MWFAWVIFIAIFGIAECKGVLWASIDAGAKEEPRAARIYQAAGEKVAPPRERLHTCQTGIAPVRGSHLYLIALCIFFSFFSVVWSQCCSSLCLFFFHQREALLLWCEVQLWAPEVILTCLAALRKTLHPPFSQLLPAQRLSISEKARPAVPHWECWKTPSKKCMI